MGMRTTQGLSSEWIILTDLDINAKVQLKTNKCPLRLLSLSKVYKGNNADHSTPIPSNEWLEAPEAQ